MTTTTTTAALVAKDGSPWPVAYTANNRKVVPGLRVRDYNYRETTVTDRRPDIDGGGASGRPATPWFHTENGGYFDGSRLFAL